MSTAQFTLEPDFLDAFVTVSCATTGFTALELQGTGLIDAHANLVVGVLAASGNADQFMNAMVTLAAAPDPSTAIPAAMQDRFMGPLLSNVIALWYLGQWLQLPASWYVDGPQPAVDTDTIPSPLAYAQAFAWRIAGAHPPGSRPTGYGGWGLQPVMTDIAPGAAS
jgi:hypothetical protein